MRRTIRDWAHYLLGVVDPYNTRDTTCRAAVSASMDAHTARCTEVCEVLVEFGAEVLNRPPPPPSTQTVGGGEEVS